MLLLRAGRRDENARGGRDRSGTGETWGVIERREGKNECRRLFLEIPVE